MNKAGKNLVDSLYMAWAIASKDIVDALKNKGVLTNILAVLGIIVFFYWMLTLRPFDKSVGVVVYDPGHASQAFVKTKLSDGSELVFYQASTLQEMEDKMVFKNLGLVVPNDFEQTLKSGGEPTLTGYIFWVQRAQATQLEAKYTRMFTEMLGQPVRVHIGNNFVIPQPNVLGAPATAAYHMLFGALWMAITVVPFLMLEEKRTKTMEALLVSPASAGNVVMGKALAGLFYVLLAGVVSFALNRAYIVNWPLAILAFLCCALFAVGLALVLGSVIKSQQQVSLWAILIVLFLLLPAFFAQEPNLTTTLKVIFAWIPTTALVTIFRYSLSSGAPLAQLSINLAVALVSAGLVFALVVWQVRRSDQ